MKPLLDEDVAAELLGTKPKTLANWRCQGGGPAFLKIGRLVKYDPDDLFAWREARRVASTSQPVAA
jgi:hypothetical protein